LSNSKNFNWAEIQTFFHPLIEMLSIISQLTEVLPKIMAELNAAIQ
jgi:hypothetical protein